MKSQAPTAGWSLGLGIWGFNPVATYSYTARDKVGVISKGSVLAGNRTAAAASLIEKGLVPILVKEGGDGKKAGDLHLPAFLRGKPKVKLAEKVIFSRQFATMINAGVPIIQSLSILAEQTPSKTLKETIAEMAKKVEGGSSLANAMADHPTIFPLVYVNMVKAGETAGILDQILDRLATQQEKDAEIIHKVRGAMIYPAVITTVTLGAFFFMMIAIVPKMAGLFADLGSKLPLYTQILLAISSFLTHFGFYLLIAAIAAGIGFARFAKTKGGKKIVDTVIIKLPIFGPIVQKVNIARFARTFGSLMSSGIAVLDALHTTGDALSNTVYKESLIKIAAEVKNGKTISQPLKANKIFPPIVSQMIMVGEETGQLDDILLKLADFYEKEVDTIVTNLTSIIEPILIIVIGGMVGSIVIGILGPIGSLTSSI